MRARWLPGEEKGRTRELWEQIFPEDTGRFLDYYYGEKTRDNRIIAAEEDGGLRAMIHLNPYRLMAGGRQIGADYVVAVATEERYRHRGYMAQLLRKALEDGRRRGNPFAFLIPANPAIYEPFGFRYVSASRELCWKPGQDQDKDQDKDKDQEWLPGQAAGQLPAGEMPAQTGRLSGQAVWLSEEGDFREAAALASSCLAGRCSVYAIRDAAYYRRLRLECMAEDGGLLGCRSWDGELQAFLACTVSQEAVEVREPFERELCAGAGQKFPGEFPGGFSGEFPGEFPGEHLETLLRELGSRYPGRRLCLSGILPGMGLAGVQEKPLMMFRVLDVEGFLSCCRPDGREHFLRVADPLLPENSGCYVWRGGDGQEPCARRTEEAEFEEARRAGKDAREARPEDLLEYIRGDGIFLHEAV